MSDERTCVEMYDGELFCQRPDVDVATFVAQMDWHESPTALMRATCIDCLETIYTLGGWAQNALSKLPMPLPQGASWNPPPPKAR